VSPPDLMNLEAFPRARARLRASAQGNRVTPVVYAWDVQWTGQQPTMTIPTTSLDAANALIEFPVDKEGPYRITLSVPGEPKCMYSARDAYAYRAVFVLRTSPGNGLPVQEDTIHLRANDPQDGAPIVMKQVEDTRIVPLHADGSPLLSFVRISQPGSDLRIDGETIHGSLTAPLSPFVSYDVLVVPDEDIAPAFFTGTSTVLRAPLVIDQGTPIRATVRDGANQPLAGARMILHRDALPSTGRRSPRSATSTRPTGACFTRCQSTPWTSAQGRTHSALTPRRRSST